MSAKAMSFSGVAPSPTPALDRGASALYGDRRPQSHPVAGFGPLTQQSAIVVHFFRTGELDGAEGIDGAET